MKQARIHSVALLVAAGFAGLARADVTFSDVMITGTLTSGATFSTGPTTIDFAFPDASVGDLNDPRRAGDIRIMYEASSTNGIDQDTLILSVLGALSGSGQIELTETVEDLNTPGVIATHTATIDANDELPHVAVLDFSRPTTRLKVTKVLNLAAPPTDAIDLANVSLIEQTLREVPEPASALLALCGMALLLRRPRKPDMP